MRASVFEEAMSDSRPSVTIRMPASLMETIKASATASGRSMNAEIVWHLEEAFRPKKVGPGNLYDDKMRARVMEIARAMIEEYGQDED